MDGPAIACAAGRAAVPGRRLPSEPSFWSAKVLLDRQIIDTAGAKVVRVNDLHSCACRRGTCTWCTSTWDSGGSSAGSAGARDRRSRPSRRAEGTLLEAEALIDWRDVHPLARRNRRGSPSQRRPHGASQPSSAELADILTELDGRERESLFGALGRTRGQALTEVDRRSGSTSSPA